MVFILTQEGDSSALYVLEWLLFMNQEVFMVSENDEIIDLSFCRDRDNEMCFDISFDKGLFSTQKVKSYWYRRGSLSINFLKYSHYPEAVFEHLEREWKSLDEFFHYVIEQNKHIGSISKIDINKLESIDEASRVGLLVPATYIHSTVDKLGELIGRPKEYITKGINNIVDYVDDANGVRYKSLTEKIEKNCINAVSKIFFPSLLQEKIEKQFEVRVFYLHGKCWSMAIFSQVNEKTAIDFRNYDMHNPNRYVPFILPEEIEGKTIKFMHSVNLNTGSLDFIVTKENTFVFLEVNPDGQFDFLSQSCNYHLELEIANYLIT